MHRNGIVVTRRTVVRVVANCLSNYYALILLLFVGQVDVMSFKMMTFRLPHDFVSSSLVNQVRRFTAMVMFNCGLLHYVCASCPR